MKNEIENIQILRGIAALMVVINHFWGGVLGGFFSVIGYFGVEIFFVISGFIMVYTQSNKKPAQFMLDRIIRIYPIYWIIALPLLLYAFGMKDIPGLLGNIMLLPSLGNPHYGMIFYPAWTLVYEVLFYCAFFFSLLISTNKYKACMTTVFLIITSVIIFGEFMEFPRQHKANLGYMLGDTLMLDFAAGCLLALVYKLIKFRIRFTFFIILRSAITIIAHKYRMPTNYAHFAFAFGVVLLALISSQAPNLIRRPMMLIGDASYSIYLSHLYVVFILERFLESGNSVSINIIASTSLLALSVIFGLFIHHAIERPVISIIKSRVTKHRHRIAGQEG